MKKRKEISKSQDSETKDATVKSEDHTSEGDQGTADAQISKEVMHEYFKRSIVYLNNLFISVSFVMSHREWKTVSSVIVHRLDCR